MAIRLVITDLDNTLYDWLGYYIPSFLAMVSELSIITGISEEDLKSSFKRVHEKHRSTEYAFGIEELDVLKDVDRSLDTGQKLRKYCDAISGFRRKRSELLRLYPGVGDTLRALKREGIQIAALSDSTTYYTSSRLRHFDIEQYFDVLAAPEDHGIPLGLDPLLVRSSSDSNDYATGIPLVLHSGESRKPSPQLIISILEATQVRPSECVLIGDSLFLDVKMAQAAGVWDVFAAYGAKVDKRQYEELLKVTYWTAADMAEYERLTSDVVQPTFCAASFSDIRSIIQSIAKQDVKDL